jgi:quercetin dioxygenase-like cupin family protein
MELGPGVVFDDGRLEREPDAAFTSDNQGSSDTAGEFPLSRVALPGGSQSPFLTTPGHSFLPVLGGELRIWFEGELHRVVAGDSVNVPAKTPFSIRADAVGNSFYRYFTDEWLHQLAGEHVVGTASHIFSRTPQHTVGDLFSRELAASLGVDRGDLLLTAFECGKVALA